PVESLSTVAKAAVHVGVGVPAGPLDTKAAATPPDFTAVGAAVVSSTGAGVAVGGTAVGSTVGVATGVSVGGISVGGSVAGGSVGSTSSTIIAIAASPSLPGCGPPIPIGSS